MLYVGAFGEQIKRDVGSIESGSSVIMRKITSEALQYKSEGMFRVICTRVRVLDPGLRLESN